MDSIKICEKVCLNTHSNLGCSSTCRNSNSNCCYECYYLKKNPGCSFRPNKDRYFMFLFMYKKGEKKCLAQ